jgi:hypothetical protein
LDLRGRKWQEAGENCIMRSFITWYASPNIRVIKSSRMRWVGYVPCMGEMRNEYKILVGNPEGKRPRERPRRRWEVNIRTYLQEVWCEVVDRIRLAQNRDQWRAVVNTATKLRVP